MVTVVHDFIKSDNDKHYCSDTTKGKRGRIGTFLDGAIKLTSSNNTAQDELTISFDEILQTEGLQKCILTGYVIDQNWLLPKLKDCPDVLLCIDDEDERSGNGIVSMTENIRIIKPRFPKDSKDGVMNVKLMLLQYNSGYLRIVISSGNLVSYDYDRIQNMLFIQDCPKLTNKNAPPMESLEFITDLSRLLYNLGIFTTSEVPREYRKFDYSKTRPKVVFSCPFPHPLTRPIGLVMLAEKIPKPFIRPSCLECQGSSLGEMKENWLDIFTKAASGNRLLLPLPPTEENVENDVKRSLLQANMTDLPEPSTIVKIVFPTVKFVNTSPLGPNEFGITFCRLQNWSQASYPRSAHYKCISNYGKGRPLHTKIITALDQTGKEAWWYIGSADFKISAWGKPNKHRTLFHAANYELGIVFSIDDIRTLCPLGFPYPYKRPLEPYAKHDLPWMQTEHDCVEENEHNHDQN